MIRTLTAVALATGVALGGGAPAPADDPPAPAPNGLDRLRAFGRPTPGPTSSLYGAAGPVTAVDGQSITVRDWFGGGVENAKEEDDSGTGRFGRWVRRDPTKPIVLSYPGWEVDCHTYRHTPEGMVVTVVTGQEVVLRNADQPARRFAAAPELLQGTRHPALPGRKHCHLLPEVRVGDVVSLNLAGPLGKEECIGVAIRRRPGGRVPHSTVDPEFFRDGIDRFNAYQAHEERGTPIPDRFRRDLRRLRAFPPDEAPVVPLPKRP
ncbi:hypothetical protein J0H58_30885 [bacterium]|nr:hypothetical protein [bacterium]